MAKLNLKTNTGSDRQIALRQGKTVILDWRVERDIRDIVRQATVIERRRDRYNQLTILGMYDRQIIGPLTRYVDLLTEYIYDAIQSGGTVTYGGMLDRGLRDANKSILSNGKTLADVASELVNKAQVDGSKVARDVAIALIAAQTHPEAIGGLSGRVGRVGSSNSRRRALGAISGDVKTRLETVSALDPYRATGKTRLDRDIEAEIEDEAEDTDVKPSSNRKYWIGLSALAILGMRKRLKDQAGKYNRMSDERKARLTKAQVKTAVAGIMLKDGHRAAKARAYTILQTETNRSIKQAMVNVAQKVMATMGLKGKKGPMIELELSISIEPSDLYEMGWMSMSQRDGDVCNICDGWDGVFFEEVEEWQAWHPNCRCYPIPMMAPANVGLNVNDTAYHGIAAGMNRGTVRKRRT